MRNQPLPRHPAKRTADQDLADHRLGPGQPSQRPDGETTLVHSPTLAQARPGQQAELVVLQPAAGRRPRPRARIASSRPRRPAVGLGARGESSARRSGWLPAAGRPRRLVPGSRSLVTVRGRQPQTVPLTFHCAATDIFPTLYSCRRVSAKMGNLVPLSRLTEVGPRLIEVGPIYSSVSLKLAHRLTAQVERPRLDSQRWRARVGELATG